MPCPCLLTRLPVNSSLASPESETVANNVVLVAHGVQVALQRLDEMKISAFIRISCACAMNVHAILSPLFFGHPRYTFTFPFSPELPNNMLALDIAYLERALFTAGERGPMHDRKTGNARLPGSLLSLGGLLRSFGIAPPCVLHHAGNDAFMTLIAFQRMVDPRGGVSVGAGMDGIGNGMGNGTGTGKGEGHVKRAATVAARFFRPLGGPHPDSVMEHARHQGHVSHVRVGPRGGVDEMGMMKNTSMKRASMFSALRVPKGVSQASTSGSGSGSGLGSGWSKIVPGSQRRHSVAEKR